MSYFVPDVEANGWRRYGKRYGNPNGTPEDNSRCVVEVSNASKWGFSSQCHRPRGHGEGGLYCKQHDPEAVKRREEKRDKQWDARQRADRTGLYAPAMYNLLCDRRILSPEAFEEEAERIVKEIEE